MSVNKTSKFERSFMGVPAPYPKAMYSLVGFKDRLKYTYASSATFVFRIACVFAVQALFSFEKQRSLKTKVRISAKQSGVQKHRNCSKPGVYIYHVLCTRHDTYTVVCLHGTPNEKYERTEYTEYATNGRRKHGGDSWCSTTDFL